MDDTPLESIKRSKKHIQYSGPPLLHIAQDFHGYISVVATSNFMF